MADDTVRELLQLSQQLLDSIALGDWPAYKSLCDPHLTAFEPEARGHLVEGMSFHRFYFDLQRNDLPHNSTISSPEVRILGDVAVVTYVRLEQTLSEDGSPRTVVCEETRVWQNQSQGWRHVHFHRSTNR